MKTKCLSLNLRSTVSGLLMTLFLTPTTAQESLHSMLINHGAVACGSSSPEQHFFSGALGASPSILFSSSYGFPFYNVYTAYNPRDHKIYYADISNGSQTKVYALDYNLSGVITAPPAGGPTYVYDHVIEQLCFDRDGNNLAISNFNSGSGLATLQRIDVATGNPIPGTSKNLVFPPGHVPNSLGWGDIVYMPNGRMFMTFGSSPSMLYELTNYDGPGDAIANYQISIPRPCYGIGYVDGHLIVAGSDGGGCYYFNWDISQHTLGTDTPFPLGKTSADISHMNVGVGTSKELVSTTMEDASTARLTYRIVLKNKGNIDLYNVQLKDDLAQVFGAGNVSGVSVNFVSNPAGLSLNPAYDGEQDINMLLPGQVISNYPVDVDSIVISLDLRATNLIPGKVYLNSAISSGQIGAGANLLSVLDSSNNGDASYIDLDHNGLSDDPGENVPTPFQFLVLLSSGGVKLDAELDKSGVSLQWMNTDEGQVRTYTLERSYDGHAFAAIGQAAVERAGNGHYREEDANYDRGSRTLYYRIRVTDNRQRNTYSNLVVLRPAGTTTVQAYPNPFGGTLHIDYGNPGPRRRVRIRLFDLTGREYRSVEQPLETGRHELSLDGLASLAKGIYVLEVRDGELVTRLKLVK
jgi:hypothetical protein